MAAGWIDAAMTAVTPAGQRLLAQEFGGDIATLRARRCTLLRPCLDWTERRPHLAGSVGALVASATLERGWVLRRTGSRGLVITAEGRAEFGRLGVTLPG